jgi:hypothetical protein
MERTVHCKSDHCSLLRIKQKRYLKLLEIPFNIYCGRSTNLIINSAASTYIIG